MLRASLQREAKGLAPDNTAVLTAQAEAERMRQWLRQPPPLLLMQAALDPLGAVFEYLLEQRLARDDRPRMISAMLCPDVEIDIAMHTHLV